MTATCALARKQTRQLRWPGALGLALGLGSAATLFVLACWLFGLRVELDLWSTHSLEISERTLRVFLWPTPRSSGHPDVWTLPLGLLLAALALPTALVWAVRRLATARRAP